MLSMNICVPKCTKYVNTVIVKIVDCQKTKTKYKLLYMNVLEKIIKKLMTSNEQCFIDFLPPNFYKFVSL